MIISHKNYKGYGIDALNRDAIDITIDTIKKNTSQIKVSDLHINLTSFPKRINEVPYILYSLLTQSLAASKIILWLSYEEFPEGYAELPNELMTLLKEEVGLTIEWCLNYGPYKKLVPAIKKYPHVINVTADDDIFYHNDWLKELYDEYQEHGDRFIYAHRAHKVKILGNTIDKYNNWEKEIRGEIPSFFNFATGCGGVLYPKNIFDDRVIKSDFTSLCKTNDDIWFWAMGILNGIQTVTTKKYNKLIYINPERELLLNDEFTLSRQNVVEGLNDVFINNVINAFPEILQKLEAEIKSNESLLKLKKQ
jgi:hypothetical protein